MRMLDEMAIWQDYFQAEVMHGICVALIVTVSIW
jgi:hypothetical protein